MEAGAVAGALGRWRFMSFDPVIDGPGKLAKVMIWRNGAAEQAELKWGFEPLEPGGRVVSLLRSERWAVCNPCLVIANDFGLKVDGVVKYRASLRTSEAFFCLAGMWRPKSEYWPASFAVLTVEAYPDLAPYKDRHVAVVRPEHWYHWLMETKPKDEILTPFPEGSFIVRGPRAKAAMGDLFGRG